MAYFLIVILAFSSYVDSSSIDSVSLADGSLDDLINNRSQPWWQPQLPETIEPIHYHLSISPEFYSNKSNYFGRVTIQVKVNHQTNIIMVHKQNFAISYWRVSDENGHLLNVTHTFENKENNYWIALTQDPLPRKISLYFQFKGKVCVVQYRQFNRCGMYKMSYVNHTTRKLSWLLTTDFYPNYSRCVFPNFDEPRFKASFRIAIHHFRNFTALSNMPEENSTNLDDIWQETTFKDTPRLSSHGIGFFISEFQSKDILFNSTLYRVWAQPDRLDKADYALNMTLIIQNFLQQEFGMSQELQKIDQIAIPGRTLDAEKKNWGLDIYKESVIILSNKTAEDAAHKFRTLTLIAQALTHNYFGNLVSCRFWSHVWLNEGFKAFYEVKTVTAVDPSFGYKEVYFGEKLESSMIMDATNASKALVPYARYPDGNLFDSLRDKKGAAILRMVENFVGTDAFRRGIRRYLWENAHNTVLTEELWGAIQQEVDPNLHVETIMRTWSYTEGIPVITVELLPGNKIKAMQKQFVEDFLAYPNPNYKWYVPLTYRTKGGNYGLVWMNRTDVVFDVPLSSSDDWIEFNVDRTGYYRVNYDDSLWFRITRQLNINHTVFTELTRSMLISDALHMAKGEQLKFHIFLGLIRYSSAEHGLVPWYHIHDGLKYLENKMVNTASFGFFQTYVLKLTRELMNELEVKDEGSCIEKQLRAKIMSLACSAGHRRCIRNTTRLFKAWIQNKPNDVDADFRRAVYCIGMAHSTLESEWNATFEKYRQATSLNEAFEWLWILSCSRNVTLLERFLDYYLANADMDDVFMNVFIKYIVKNPSVESVAWNWLKRNYAEIDQKIRVGHTGYLMTEAVHSLKTRAQLQEVLAFYDVYTSVSEYEKQTINTTINGNIRFMEKHFFTIYYWLQQNVKS